MKIFFRLTVFVITVMCLNFTSCKKTCLCTDRNSGYVYPEIDYKEAGYKNCSELQKAENASGASVSCYRPSVLE